ncbi:hypothetical protein BDV12DRAFT_176752 [Aspergillus spectabilis]
MVNSYDAVRKLLVQDTLAPTMRNIRAVGRHRVRQAFSDRATGTKSLRRKLVRKFFFLFGAWYVIVGEN